MHILLIVAAFAVSAPTQCQNVSEFGGLWLVVRPNGTLVR